MKECALVLFAYMAKYFCDDSINSEREVIMCTNVQNIESEKNYKHTAVKLLKVTCSN